MESNLVLHNGDHKPTEKQYYGVYTSQFMKVTILDIINYMSFVKRHDDIDGLHDKIESILTYIKNLHVFSIFFDESIRSKDINCYVYSILKDLTDSQVQHIVDVLTNIDTIKKDGEDNGIDHSHIIELFTLFFCTSENKITIVEELKNLIKSLDPDRKTTSNTFLKFARYAVLPITIPLAFTFGALSGGFHATKKLFCN